jgi:hypothetical protein
MRKNDEKDKKILISVPRSSAHPLPDGELNKLGHSIKYMLIAV